MLTQKNLGLFVVVATALVLWGTPIMAADDDTCRLELRDNIDFCLSENPGLALGDIICILNAIEDYMECLEGGQPPSEVPSQFCSSVFYENNRTALVTRVIDGDTIELDGGERVRYIGMDTPEEGESGFDEATQRNTELVEGKTIILDVCEEEPEDPFGRTLAYVIVDSTVVNEVLLVEGLAVPLFIPPCGTETAECYEQIDLDPDPDPDPGECDPSYPTVCIPSPPPDLDCGEIPYDDFTVLPPDPHGFDGDGDGIGCET